MCSLCLSLDLRLASARDGVQRGPDTGRVAHVVGQRHQQPPGIPAGGSGGLCHVCQGAPHEVYRD